MSAALELEPRGERPERTRLEELLLRQAEIHKARIATLEARVAEMEAASRAKPKPRAQTEEGLRRAFELERARADMAEARLSAELERLAVEGEGNAAKLARSARRNKDLRGDLERAQERERQAHRRLELRHGEVGAELASRARLCQRLEDLKTAQALELEALRARVAEAELARRAAEAAADVARGHARAWQAKVQAMGKGG